MRVEVLHSQDDLDKVELSHWFLEPALLLKMEEEFASRTEVKHEVDIVFRLDGVFMASDEEGMLS